MLKVNHLYFIYISILLTYTRILVKDNSVAVSTECMTVQQQYIQEIHSVIHKIFDG